MLNRDKSAKIRESDNMFWKAKPEFQLSIKRCEVRNHDGAESRKLADQHSRLTELSKIEEYEQKWSRKKTKHQVI